MKERRKTRTVKVGNLALGGEFPIRVQSMTKTETLDVEKTVEQIKSLQDLGCEIIRVAVPNIKTACVLKRIKSQIQIPLVADVHFDAKIALKAIEQGVDKIRINPGNIKDRRLLKDVVELCKEKSIPIRIGVNSGSVDRKRYKANDAKSLVDSALDFIKLFEDWDFDKIVISLKAHEVLTTIQAYRIISERTDYPLHIGITEAGLPLEGSIKSSVGLGILLYEGIGDTIRVSLTGPPQQEVKVGFEILKSLNLREYGPTLISCPTCARCKVDLFNIAKKVQDNLKDFNKSFKVAVMGCVVNGPGEASTADIGIALSGRQGAIFKKGKVIKKVAYSMVLDEFLQIMKEEFK